MVINEMNWIQATLLFISTLLITTVAPAAATLSRPENKAELSVAIDALLAQTDLRGGTIAIYAQDYQSGEAVYSREARTPLKPASCNKIHTTAAALYYLGPDFRYETPIYAAGEIRRNTLHGDLIVRGSGDPTISARFQRNRNDLTGVFRGWATQIYEQGVRRIEGRVIGDDSFFDDQYFGDGWYPRERAEWYCAEISALSFNDNCVDLVFTGGRDFGGATTFEVQPATDLVTINNRVQTRRSSSTEYVTFYRQDRSNVIEARGAIRPGSIKREWAAIHNPTLFTVSIFRNTLIANGVRVELAAADLDDLKDYAMPLLAAGKPAEAALGKGAGSDGQARAGSSPAEAASSELKPLITHTSPPLRDIISVINLNSQNFYAECVLKTLGARLYEKGSFRAGGDAVEAFLRRENLWTPGSAIVDGSGLSYMNRTSAEQLVNVLRWVRQKPEWWGFYRESLPQGGRTGTLNKRFQHSDDAKSAAAQVFGKTGYIGGVRSMAGVIYTANGREVHYAIIANDFNTRDTVVIELIDDLAATIARSRI